MCPHFSFAFRKEGGWKGLRHPNYGGDLLDADECVREYGHLIQLNLSEDMAYDWEDLVWKPYPTHRLVSRYMCCLTCASLKSNERCPFRPEGYRKEPPLVTDPRESTKFLGILIIKYNNLYEMKFWTEVDLLMPRLVVWSLSTTVVVVANVNTLPGFTALVRKCPFPQI